MGAPVNVTSFLEKETGPANIPKMKFIEDVASFLAGRSVDEALASLHELLSKYKYMEQSFLATRRSLQNKLPDIQGALDSVLFLLKQREEKLGTIRTRFLLSENVNVSADVSETDYVMLWLGANTLLEFPLEEAKTLLETNQASATKSIQDLKESLEFLRCQVTTTEVNIARVHNYGVTLRQQQQPQLSSPRPAAPVVVP